MPSDARGRSTEFGAACEEKGRVAMDTVDGAHELEPEGTLDASFRAAASPSPQDNAPELTTRAGYTVYHCTAS